MLKSYLKIAFRNLRRSKGFSAMNIIGLAIGMASAIIILLWIQNEVSYDRYHEKKDRIYEAWNRATLDNKLTSWSTTPKVLARALEKDLPEVEQATRVNWPAQYLLSAGDKRLFVGGNIVDPNFLQMFSFPLIKGDPGASLKETYSLVITEKLAIRLFGKEEDAMGKTIKINNGDDFKVTGILKDLPNNTKFNFECLLPWTYLQKNGGDDNNWNNNSTQTYVLLKSNASLASIEPKIKIFKQKYDGDAKKDNWQMFLYPISRWRLYSDFENGYETHGGRITLVKLFGTIAAFILLIACINFMNLSTARSEKRAKEVGIRKVVGAQKGSLISQFIGESILLAFIAGIIAIIIVQLSLSGFNQLTDKSLFIPYGSPYFWMGAMAFVVFTGFLAGSYPAFFLSSFQPVKVLKGSFKKAHALVAPRKVLVVLQFTFAIILIICTIIVKQQIDYTKDRELGYDKRNLIYLSLTNDMDKNYSLIKNELLTSGVASSITKTSAPITERWNGGTANWGGKDPNDKTEFNKYVEDGSLGATAGLKFVTGRDIDPRRYLTDSTAILLNESALKVMKFKNPLGQIIDDEGRQWHVVGVIKDFIIESPYEPTRPMLIYGPKGWFSTIQIKLNNENSTAQNLKMAETIFKRYNPEFPFEYRFVDEEYAKKFEDEKRTGTLAGLFAGLTIFISCLGLFGLATYMAEARIKEIGVRKVLGASVINITALLSQDFIRLVLVSILIASPVAWLAMHKWLQGYDYRININGLVFVVSGSLAILIALLTVSFQAIKAALANPVKSLRTE
ncbi:MAG: ABC transporter permease [Puia sp.]|nr:ABC transporter permease [Puia sp.]